MEQNSAIYSALNTFGESLVEALKNALPVTSDTTQQLRNSIVFQLQLGDDTYTFQLSLADYYYWVDKGRGPGKAPPLQPSVIANWITARGIKFQPKNLKAVVHRKNYNAAAADARQQKSLAFLIGRKIARQGTKGTGFFSSVVTPELIDKLKADLQPAFQTDIQIKVTELVNEFNK